MAEGGAEQPFDVIRSGVVASVEGRRGLGSQQKQDFPASAGAEGKLAGAPGGHRQLDDVALDLFVDEDGPDLAAAVGHGGGVEDRLHPGRRRVT